MTCEWCRHEVADIRSSRCGLHPLCVCLRVHCMCAHVRFTDQTPVSYKTTMNLLPKQCCISNNSYGDEMA